VPKRTLRDPPRSRVKLAGARRRAHGEANRAVATGRARFLDEYVKEQEEPRGRWNLDYESPLCDVDHVSDEFGRIKGIGSFVTFIE